MDTHLNEVVQDQSADVRRLCRLVGSRNWTFACERRHPPRSSDMQR